MDLMTKCVKKMPVVLEGYHDFMQHKTVADLIFMVETAINLYNEGEETDITPATIGQVRRYLQFLKEQSHAAKR